MWMRREAMMRRPASSSLLVSAPVRLRRVASGLMIEKVRVTAMESSIVFRVGWEVGRAPSGRRRRRQGSRLFDPAPALARPIVPLDPVAAGEKLPRQAGALDR